MKGSVPVQASVRQAAQHALEPLRQFVLTVPCWTLVHHVPSFRCQALKHPSELPLWDQAVWFRSERTAHRLHGQLLCGHSLLHVCELKWTRSSFPAALFHTLLLAIYLGFLLYVGLSSHFILDSVLLTHKSTWTGFILKLYVKKAIYLLKEKEDPTCRHRRCNLHHLYHCWDDVMLSSEIILLRQKQMKCINICINTISLMWHFYYFVLACKYHLTKTSRLDLNIIYSNFIPPLDCFGPRQNFTGSLHWNTWQKKTWSI